MGPRAGNERGPARGESLSGIALTIIASCAWKSGAWQVKTRLPRPIMNSKHSQPQTLGQHFVLWSPLLESPNFSNSNFNPPGTEFYIGHGLLLTMFMQYLSPWALIDHIDYVINSHTLGPSQLPYCT